MPDDPTIRDRRRQRLDMLLRLAQLRCGWTRRELAAALGRDASNLLVSTGLPKIDLLWRLADALQWRAGDVLEAIAELQPGDGPRGPRASSSAARGDDEQPSRASTTGAVAGGAGLGHVNLGDVGSGHVGLGEHGLGEDRCDSIARLLRDARFEDARDAARRALRRSTVDGLASVSAPAARARPAPDANRRMSEREVVIAQLAASHVGLGDTLEARALLGGTFATPWLRAAVAAIGALALRLDHQRGDVSADVALRAIREAEGIVPTASSERFRCVALPGAATGPLLAAAAESVRASAGRIDVAAALEDASNRIAAGGDRSREPARVVDGVRVAVQRCLWLIDVLLPSEHGETVDGPRTLDERLLQHATSAALRRCAAALVGLDDWALRASWFLLEARRRVRLTAWTAADPGWTMGERESCWIAGLVSRQPSLRRLAWSMLDCARPGAARLGPERVSGLEAKRGPP